MPKPHDGGAARPQRLVLSSDELPAGMGDDARLRRWREIRAGTYGAMVDSFAEDRPFAARFELAFFGSAALGEFTGTLTGVWRTAREVAADNAEEFILGVNLGRGAVLHRQHGRETVVAPGGLSLSSYAEPSEMRYAPVARFRTIVVPRERLTERVASADDLVALTVDPDLPAARLLRRYLDILLGPDGIEDDPLLADHVATTLIDLIALALGAGRDAAEVARMRGLRAARLQAVLAEIKAGFAQEGFSVRHVGRRLGLSPRCVQDLLHETGGTFSERVLELRLQKSRAMLAGRSGVGMSVSHVAYACGFSDVSYFNRCFRRRYGMTPSEARGAGPDDGRQLRSPDGPAR